MFWPIFYGCVNNERLASYQNNMLNSAFNVNGWEVMIMFPEPMLGG